MTGPGLPQQATSHGVAETMVICGDDALAHRLATELRVVYREHVTLVVPDTDHRSGQATGTGRARASIMLGRLSAVVNRAAGHSGPAASAGGADSATAHRVVEAAELSDEVLVDAGVENASALALVHDDDETNIRAALAARRLNPRLRLVIRLYNRRLGQHLKELLDQAARLASPDAALAADVSTTVLYDADTVAPALAAAAVAGSSKVVQADGLLLRAAEVGPSQSGHTHGPGLCTLALLSATDADPAGAEGSDESGAERPQLLPDEASVDAAANRATVVLETVSYSGPALAPRRSVQLTSLLSRRLRWSFTTLVAGVCALAVASVLTTGDHPLHATYLTLLDLFAINDPAVGEPTGRQVVQLLSGLVGLLLLPVLLAAVLEALGTFRHGAMVRRPPRGLSGHVVLLGLGKIGSRVLAQLRELDIPVVCVEKDSDARGMAVARRLRVPVVIGDVTQEGVLESAKIQRAHSLLALTSADSTNLEAALYARTVKPDLRVVLRLYDDNFAAAVYRTLRAAHPRALTRSRSVSQLAAPAFAGAMMGRHVLGAIPVERRVLVFAVVDVAGHPQWEGLTVAEAFRPGHWRIIALDTTPPEERRADLTVRPPYGDDAHTPGLVWELDPGRVLRAEDRVVLAATRLGLAELLGRHRPRTTRTR